LKIGAIAVQRANAITKALILKDARTQDAPWLSSHAREGDTLSDGGAADAFVQLSSPQDIHQECKEPRRPTQLPNTEILAETLRRGWLRYIAAEPQYMQN
jgi:hypothetical protein